jgi:hypothetical protein
MHAETREAPRRHPVCGQGPPGVMAQPEEDAEPQQLRLEAVLCPHCEQVTMPNLLGDRSAVCSCPAERALPLDLLHGTPWDGMPSTSPPPVDGASPTSPCLPEDHGQFGRDVATEAFAPLASPPGRKG